jgi:hypothetical protein
MQLIGIQDINPGKWWRWCKDAKPLVAVCENLEMNKWADQI